MFRPVLWLSVTLTLATSGTNWLSQALTGSLWLLILDLSLSLSGSLWLSMTPTLAPTGSHCHSLDYSGPIWPSLAHYCSLILLILSLLGSQRRCHADAFSPGLV